MSGLEALGVAASIIQVADLSTKLSVKLFSFYRQVKNSNKSVQLLSNEVALISAILRELGDNLKAEESAKLCSDEAFRTLELGLDQCRDVLRQIERVVVGVNDRSGTTRLQQVTGRFRLVLLEPSLDPLKTNLERLKSTMLLLLNVIMYAGQIRSNNVPLLLEEQRGLIENLLEERQNDNQNPRRLNVAAESPQVLPADSASSKSTQMRTYRISNQKSDLNSYQTTLLGQPPEWPIRSAKSIDDQTRAYEATDGSEPAELKEYNVLIQRMLHEIDLCKCKLEVNRHLRIKNGVLNIHSGEIMRFQSEHGPSIQIDHSLFAEQKSENVSKSKITPSPPPPPPQNGNQPRISATYIPGNDTIGIGIPALFETTARAQSETYGRPPRHSVNQAHVISSLDATYARDDPAHYGNIHELVTHDNAQPPSNSQHPDVGKSASHRHHGSGNSMGGLSPSETAFHWPLDRVLLWLAVNGFSDDWQETFKTLELQGAEFLELGLGFGGRGNLGKMHQVVYPQLAKECARRGSKYNQAHEREEGKRMRRLIRQIHDGSQETSVSRPRQTEPPLFSVEALPGFYSNAEPRSAGGCNDMFADPSAALQASSSAQRTNGQMRSVTGPPTSAGHDSSAHDSPSRESATWLRSEASQNALSSLSDHRRKSPSISSDTGPYLAPSSYRQDKDSPKSGSPAMQQVSPSCPGLSSSSATDLTIRHEHFRGNSTESIPGVGYGHGSTERYYDSRRQGPDRPSPQDRQFSSEIPSSLPREHSKGNFNLFRRKAKPDWSQTSPEYQFLESPTSPEAHPNGPYPPYLKLTLNSSNVSVAERPSSTHTVDPKKVERAKHTSKGKRWIFVTMDGWNYSLVDVSEMETVESLRAEICQKLGISDWGNVQIFVTEPGQSEHGVPVSDTNLSLYRRNRSDPYGSLKLFARRNLMQSAQSTPQVDGLGISIPEKPVPSPTASQYQLHRKPLDEDALNRISPHIQAKYPSSPSQSTFKASSFANELPDRTADPEKDTQSQKSFEHDFEFEQHEVSFQRPPNLPEEETDDSSDDGLWTTRPAYQTKQTEASPQKQRPTLPVDANNRNSEARFKSPIVVGRSAHSSGGEASDGKEPPSGIWYGPDTPEEVKQPPPHGESFAREDIRASRPSVEGVIDDLDNFFPNIDLEAPYLDGPPLPNGPTAGTLLTRHPFSEADPTYDFLNTELYANSRGVRNSTDSNCGMALPENFEELLLRWTKLGRNEVQALRNPRSQVTTI